MGDGNASHRLVHVAECMCVSLYVYICVSRTVWSVDLLSLGLSPSLSQRRGQVLSSIARKVKYGLILRHMRLVQGLFLRVVDEPWCC
jgi:hypothetical protein